MIDIFPDITRWVDQGNTFALATVINTWGSAPRKIGSALAISQNREMLGSVSGGCVEGAVVKKAIEVLESGRPTRMHFGVSDEEAWAVGLTCGGKLDVFLEPAAAFSTRETEVAAWQSLRKTIENNRAGVWLSSMDVDAISHTLVQADGTTIGAEISDELKQQALEAGRQRKNQVIGEEGNQYFALAVPRKSQLLIIGAAHITADLVSLAQQFDFEAIVIDPRGFFAQNTRFPAKPDQMFAAWPEEALKDFDLDAHTYAVVLSHNPKIDDQALKILLASDVAYIGALGSRRNHAKRVARMTEAGFSEAEISRIHGPVGVDINAQLSREIALSIMAEIIQTKNQFL